MFAQRETMVVEVSEIFMHENARLGLVPQRGGHGRFPPTDKNQKLKFRYN
jgi:hypothetical protein